MLSLDALGTGAPVLGRNINGRPLTGTTPAPTRSASSRPRVESFVTSTSRRGELPPSVVTVASSFLE